MFEPIALSDGQPEASKRQSRSSCGRRSEKAVGVRPKALCDRSPLLLPNRDISHDLPAIERNGLPLFDERQSSNVKRRRLNPLRR